MHINVVVIGHVDSGKSTTTGKLTSIFDSTHAQDTHNTYRPLDLQVRRYRQAYHREVREGEHIFAVVPLFSSSFRPYRQVLPLGGAILRFAPTSKILRPGLLVMATRIHPTPATTINYFLHGTSHTLLQHLFAP
jgi:hypothetical protein